MIKQLRIFLVVLSVSLGLNAFAGEARSVSDIKIMTAAAAQQLHKLYRVFPEGEIETAPQMEGSAIFESQIWGSNLADECDYDNFASVCKATKLYVTVTTADLGGQYFGIELGPAYEWKLAKVVYRATGTPCVELQLIKREIKSVRGKNSWIMVPYAVCIAPTGLVEGLQSRNSKQSSHTDK